MGEIIADEVVEIVRLLKSGGIDVWIDGGWGVDALLGEQSRPHSDVDIVIREGDIARAERILSVEGYQRVEGGRPFNFVMTNRNNRSVDVHAVVFDADGNGLYGPQPAGGRGERYPAAALTAHGTIKGETVRCVSAEFQVLSHTGYDLTETDFHDVFALHRRFGVALPDEYPLPEDVP